MIKKIFRQGYYLIYGASGKTIQINNKDYTVSAHVARGVSKVVNDDVMKILTNLVKQADVVFDIGANIGIIAILLSKEMKKGSILHSFEPAPLSFKYLADTVRVFKGNAKIIPLNYAVSNKTDKLYFTNNGNSCTNHISMEQAKDTISVDAITIDEYCRKTNVIPQVIKIDIEGAEYWALEGMTQTLKNNDCMVLVEVHVDFLKENNIDGEMFGKIIDQIGYKIFDITGKELERDQMMSTSCVVLSKTRPSADIFKIDRSL